MKKVLLLGLTLTLCCSTGSLTAKEKTGKAAEEGAFTSISTSMVGWGLGLGAAFALVAALVHQSKAAHSSSK